MAGSMRMAMPRFVMGPVVTMVIGSSLAIRVSTMYCTACFSCSFRVISGNTGPSRPVSP